MSRDVCFPKAIHTQHTPSSIRLQEFCVSFHVIFHLKRTPDILYCTVLFFFPPTLPPWVILRNVIGWQRGLFGISLAVVYFSFVFLINFSQYQKVNCVLFVSGGIVGELVSFGFASWFPTLISCSPNLPRVYIRLCKHGNHFTFLHYYMAR